MATVDSPVGAKAKLNTSLNRSIMVKKYKLNDGPSYVETSTLLAPENQEKNAWVRRTLSYQQLHAQERKDISTQLAQLRKKHDDVKKASRVKERQVEECKKEIEQLEGVIASSQNKTETVTGKQQQLQKALDITTIKMTEEQLLSDSYEYMLVRIKKDLIAQQIKNKKAEESLRDKEMIATVEEEKSRKSNADRQKANKALKGLFGTMEQQNHQRKNRMDNLSMAIQSKKDAEARKQERLKRQMEIAEAASNENKDSSELQMRESLLIHKFWNGVLKRKMENEMKRSAPIEEAFQRIRTATGLSDVNSFVNKFLTREQEYASLLVAVADSSRRIEVLKQQNQELQGKLKQKKIDSEGTASGHDDDVDGREKELTELRRLLKVLQTKQQRAQIIYDKVRAWSRRVGAKLPELEGYLDAQGIGKPDGKGAEGQTEVKKLFDDISSTVCSTLEHLGLDQGDNSGLMSQYMSDNFVNKNIRVRPTSAYVAADETSSRMSHGSPHRDDEHFKFDQMVNMEMEEQRNLIKEKLKDKNEEAMRKKKAEKKDEKK